MFSHMTRRPSIVVMTRTSPSCDTTKPMLPGFCEQYLIIDLCLVPKWL